jgi:UDP-N-acetylglucosamine 2-epimerase (non-hydrolysing)
MQILHVVGARPNFMKAAPVLSALGRRSRTRQTLIHTGQHYDANMSDVFFTQLQIPAPDLNLEVGSGTQAQQTAQIMSRFEPVLLRYQPDIVVVYGDVNSTVAAALVCAKLQIPVAHVEAGLRAFDRSMPEEINRVVTDHVADWLFTHCEDADRNLQQEGIARGKVHNVGNVMIDSLVRFLPLAEQCKMNGPPQKFALVTLHRPSNVDDPCALKKILESLIEVNRRIPVVFPVHPRTRSAIAGLGFTPGQLHFVDPLPYVEFLSLERQATVVITDSGGIQEETTYLGVPCITLRDNTERPITVSLGTNVLVGQDSGRMQDEILKVLEGKAKQGKIPPLWDGRASDRIAEVLQKVGSGAV